MHLDIASKPGKSAIGVHSSLLDADLGISSDITPAGEWGDDVQLDLDDGERNADFQVTLILFLQFLC